MPIPFKALNLFELLYWYVLALGIAHFGKRGMKPAWTIVLGFLCARISNVAALLHNCVLTRGNLASLSTPLLMFFTNKFLRALCWCS